MSKINRFNGDVKAFASQSHAGEFLKFGSSTEVDRELSAQITPEFLRGWGIVTSSDVPPIEWFNSLGFTLSQFIAYLHQMGVPEWNAQQEYHRDSVVTHAGVVYMSISSNNVGQDPSLSPQKWSNIGGYNNHHQFAPHRMDRIYHAGEICYTQDPITHEVSYWQWYSNVESLAGKDPLDTVNRHSGWARTDKPFYWIEYKANIIGMPFFWIDTAPPEWAVMEINVDLPSKVYWRLARRYPSLEFVRNNVSYINTGEIRAEFLRVLDQGRGIDVGRSINSKQLQAIQSHRHGFTEYLSDHLDPTGGPYIFGGDSGGAIGSTHYVDDFGGAETRPSNVARPMCIAI